MTCHCSLPSGCRAPWDGSAAVFWNPCDNGNSPLYLGLLSTCFPGIRPKDYRVGYVWSNYSSQCVRKLFPQWQEKRLNAQNIFTGFYFKLLWWWEVGKNIQSLVPNPEEQGLMWEAALKHHHSIPLMNSTLPVNSSYERMYGMDLNLLEELS